MILRANIAEKSRGLGWFSGPVMPRSIRAEILILTARVNFNP